MIALVGVVFAGAALAVSLAQSPTYVSEASLAFSDVTQDLPIVGGSGLPQQSPPERAARNAQLIAGDEIAAAASRRLDTDLSADTLSGAVSARVGVQTNLVALQARWGSPDFAAEIANAFAEAAAERANRDERERLTNAIKGLESGLDGDSTDSTAEQFSEATIAQLRAARAFSTAAEITTPATAPGAPASPRPARNTVLGLLVGLVFGVVVGFVRDSLDRRLRDPRQIHDELGLPVLGRIGATALGSAGLASANGFFLTARDRESFRMLRTNLAFLETDEPLRSVLVTSGLAEEGKSTVAAALATTAATAGLKTLLIDCDLRRPVLAKRLGMNAKPGISEFLSGTANPAEILQVKTIPPQPQPGLPAKKASLAKEAPPAADAASFVFIAAGTPAAQITELFASDRCRDFLTKVSRAYDFVVIDTSPMLAAADTLELIPHVDGILLCVRVVRSTREEVSAVRNGLALLPERPSGVVVTGLKSDDGSYGYYGYDYSG